METRLPELLRQAMRQWTTGVAVVTSRSGERIHGLTANSFTSVSLNPPIVTVTLADLTRTRELVEQSGVFAITILGADQRDLADHFSGASGLETDRFTGLNLFTLATGAPLIRGGLAYLDCRVNYARPLGSSTLYLGDVAAVEFGAVWQPLVYHNRQYVRIDL